MTPVSQTTLSQTAVSPATEAAQRLASDPARSVFVAANAGSGKTHVLTERVVRLLLAGADPSKVLCLTYTKAAAAEMQTRVFARLAGWTTLPDADLAAALRRLEAGDPSPARLREARRLFARALETPGGLKIQTIHAFCEAILHQFPLEANIPGHFEVMDETASAILLAEARRLLVAGASAGPDAEDAEEAILGTAFADALALAGEWGLDALVAEIVAKRDRLRRHLDAVGGVEGAAEHLRRALGLGADESETTILEGAIDPPGLDEPFREALAEAAARSAKATDAKLSAKLLAFDTAEDPALRFAALKAILLKADGEPYKPASVATKAVSERFADFTERLEEATAFVSEASERLATLRLARASRAALVIAGRLEADYAALKRRRGQLDFEDLIVRTADLLLRTEASAWVHYKLDRGIDHVLVDEAQDTSPRQWEVVRQLVEEFFAGAAARERPRTVFAVGDEKQSIYSFQGASPAMFSAERTGMERLASHAGLPFSRVELHQSFRSVADILQAVDEVFAEPADRRGLSAGDEPPVHVSARAGEPGLIEVWPALVPAAVAASDDWLAPIDHQPESSPANRLARRIAAQIAEWIGQPIRVKGVERPLGAGDMLVLVRKRSGFVAAMGAALREAGIPVAGADRLVITDHIAVADLVALGRVVSNAEDELSLAAVLKSPLFGFDDDDLMALALSRGTQGQIEPLYLALRRLARPEGATRLPAFVPAGARASLLAKAAGAFSRLEELRRRAGFETVFPFFARILGPEGGRAKLGARLGRDAGDVVDAFLDLALAEEEAGRGGLDAFLANITAAPPTIKREMEHGRGEVRIMTTHASKGLEAPVVFLVDPGSAPFSHAHSAKLMEWTAMPGLVPGTPPGFLWCPEAALRNEVVTSLREAEKARAEDEYRRLLYVGLTRAADRLVVCGLSGVRGPDENSWLQRVEAALGRTARDIRDPATGERTALRLGADPAAVKLAPQAGEAPRAVRPIDLSPLPPEPAPPRPLSPSSAGGAHRIEALDDSLPPAGPERPVSPVLGSGGEPGPGLRRGALVHRLLQLLPDLPPAEREPALRDHLDTAGAFLDRADRARLADQILAILDDPAFAPFFAPGSRAEVALSGRLELGGHAYRVNGTIDRLSVDMETVRILDYKTNRPHPRTLDAVPEPYLLQLALYRDLVRPLYPGRRVSAALLFTEGPLLMELPDERLDAALALREARARTPMPEAIEPTA
ncbi:double-strand break repair helicase AddA [Aureimonas pseudogalii]|uniref:DNA 3'-5' helicase n=1 Tax=Aureimonas pseudogalii TaxID=1744844 RepID=A0A7W6ECZ1_9HYPH|nr:double-strand break repair helicase AddA [Aureimonas pseudogalii]MBB3997751.1 ATP-dependent helicase/nuclease subunit A [Aureimonas pseudogalii]